MGSHSTAEVQLRSRLAQTLEFFRLVVGGVEDYAIILLDWDGKVVSWNAGARRIKGYPADEILGQHFSRFYIPEEARSGKPARALEIAARTGQYREEGQRVRKDGSLFWASVVVNAVRLDGEVTGFVKITRDLTRQREAEEQRFELTRAQAARAEAEKANRMKDEFLATLSHELRTPLNAIVGWAQLLAEGALTPAQATQALQSIRRNATVQTQIVSDVLDVSRIISGKMRLNPQRVELVQAVAAAVDTLQPAASAKLIDIRWTPPPGPLWIWADPDRLQQVAWNLLSNAVKFTPREGRVEVSVGSVGSDVELTVADTGKGIAADFLPYVFETFRQADSSSSRRHGGLGLGLAIVKHLVELHGGQIEARSEGEDRGATFRVSIPILRREAAAGGTEKPARTAPRLDGVKVLLVEDHEDTRVLVATVLEQLGATVLPAADADEGFRLVVAERPDIVVSDIELPGETGYALMQKVRALPSARGGLTPGIALTAYARPEDRVRAMLAGYDVHLAKPALPQELAVFVARLAGGSRSDL